LPSIAAADDVRLHALGAATRALGEPQARELGWGAGGSVAFERPFGDVVGLQIELLAFALTDGAAPVDATLADRHGGGLIGGALGARVRPFGGADAGGFWLDANGGLARTGSSARPIFDGHIGFDVAIGNARRIGLGPAIGYTHVFQPDDTIRPEDAHVLWLGLHAVLGFGSNEVTKALRGDKDGDSVFDDEDACPDEPGSRTSDPRTNGCPRRDRDGDSVFDDEDACPYVSGRRTTDPKTHGCPRLDRDGDAVFDDEDACPNAAGIRTNDPKTNGCPRRDPDRDGDTVFDDEDACPDVPGIRTADVATNGCPKAEGPVHVAGDKIVLDERIVFDSDSPRVRHASFGLLKRVATFIGANPDVLEIDIEGHADRVGTDAHNLQLSRERAESVKRLLVKFGIDAARLTTHYYGESRPRASGVGEDQLRENRRVEFTVIRTQSKVGAGATTNPEPTTPNGAPQ
jgi:OmpA-OmpF porin, OOP family